MKNLWLLCHVAGLYESALGELKLAETCEAAMVLEPRLLVCGADAFVYGVSVCIHAMCWGNFISRMYGIELVLTGRSTPATIHIYTYCSYSSRYMYVYIPRVTCVLST